MNMRRTVFILLLILTVILPVVPPTPGLAAAPESDQPVKIESSTTFTAALRGDNTLWVWGMNDNAQLGTSGSGSMYPRLLLEDIVDFAVGENFAVALDKDGDIWVWGQLFFSDIYFTTPQKFDFSSDPIIAVDADRYHLVALSDSGHVYTLGWGPLGRGISYDTSAVPVMVLTDADTALGNIVQIAAAEAFSVAKAADGTVYVWERSGSTFATPFDSGLSGNDSIFAGGYVGFLTKGEEVYGWGRSYELGLPTPNDYTTPTLIPELSNIGGIRQISSTFTHSLALSNDGTVYGTGESNYGQMGKFLNSYKPFAPIPELSDPNATQIFARPYVSYVQIGGQMYGMGYNHFDDGTRNLLGAGYTNYDLPYDPVPLADLTDNIQSAPGKPFNISVVEEGPGAYSFGFEMPPFSSSNRAFVDVYRLDNHEYVTTYSESISEGRRWETVYIDSLQPGTYYFNFYTAYCPNNDTCESSDSVTLDNGGEGFVIDEYHFDYTVYVKDPEGNPAIQYSVVLTPPDSFNDIELQTDNEGKAVFEKLPAGDYQLEVYGPDETWYYRDYIYLIQDTTTELRLYTALDYQIQDLSFVPISYDPSTRTLSGTLFWDSIWAEEEIEQYRIYWFDSQGDRIQLLDTVTRDVYGETYVYTYQVDNATAPSDAIGLTVLTYDGSIEIDSGARVEFIPFLSSLDARIIDADPEPDIARRTVVWKGLNDESTITHYVLKLDGYKIAEIKADKGPSATYSFPFGTKEYGGVLQLDLQLYVKYRWGESQVSLPIHPVDYVLNKTEWLNEYMNEDLQPPNEQQALFLDQNSDPDLIEGWLTWPQAEGAGQYDINGYEIVFLDEERSYLGSILTVYDIYQSFPAYKVYIPETPVPACAAYLGIYSRRYSGISESPAAIPIDIIPCESQEPGPADGNRILSTKYGILDEQNGKITHIPAISLAELTAGANLQLPQGAKVKMIRYNNIDLEPDIPFRVMDGMQLYVEDSDGNQRIYTLWTLRYALLKDEEYRVELDNILRYLFQNPQDFTGDGKFDEEDIEWLLKEIDPVVTIVTS
jgi:hypothetical protein